MPVTKLGRLVKEGRIRSLEVSTGAENEFKLAGARRWRLRRLDAVFVIARESLDVAERFRDPFFRAGNLPSLDAD